VGILVSPHPKNIDYLNMLTHYVWVKKAKAKAKAASIIEEAIE
jgi:hypothetical protein